MPKGKYPSELSLATMMIRYDDNLHREWLDVITLELID